MPRSRAGLFAGIFLAVSGVWFFVAATQHPSPLSWLRLGIAVMFGVLSLTFMFIAATSGRGPER